MQPLISRLNSLHLKSNRYSELSTNVLPEANILESLTLEGSYYDPAFIDKLLAKSSHLKTFSVTSSYKLQEDGERVLQSIVEHLPLIESVSLSIEKSSELNCLGNLSKLNTLEIQHGGPNLCQGLSAMALTNVPLEHLKCVHSKFVVIPQFNSSKLFRNLST